MSQYKRDIYVDDKRAIKDAVVICDVTPQEVFDWLNENTAYIFDRKKTEPHKVMPQYGKRVLISELLVFAALICMGIMGYNLYMAAKLPNGTDKTRYSNPLLYAFFCFAFCMVLSCVIKIYRNEKHFRVSIGEAQTRILHDGRIAVVRYRNRINTEYKYVLKRIREADEPCTSQESLIPFLYINIYSRVTGLEEVPDGLKVTWSGEKYYTWVCCSGRHRGNHSGRSGVRIKIPLYYRLFKMNMENAEEMFPNLIDNTEYLKQSLYNLKNKNDV